MSVVVAVLLLAGCLLTVLAAAGLHRLPDVLCRMHAATKPASLGLLLIGVATALHVEATGAEIKLLLVVVLQFLTAPAGAHMVGRAAFRDGLMVSETRLDEGSREAGWAGDEPKGSVAPDR